MKAVRLHSTHLMPSTGLLIVISETGPTEIMPKFAVSRTLPWVRYAQGLSYIKANLFQVHNNHLTVLTDF